MILEDSMALSIRSRVLPKAKLPVSVLCLEAISTLLMPALRWVSRAMVSLMLSRYEEVAKDLTACLSRVIFSIEVMLLSLLISAIEE